MKEQFGSTSTFSDNLFAKAPIREELLNLLEKLCRIPAPSGYEDRRTAFITDWLQKEARIPSSTDSAKNVLVFFGPRAAGGKKLTLLTAHTDTVFPDMEPMPLVRDEHRISCPGVGDNTACVAILMLYLKYRKGELEASPVPLLFAFNTCEEGLGNLKGIRRLLEDYAEQIREVTAFDGGVKGICNQAVGSLRYQVTIRTRGGHSFNDFGNASAVEAMTDLIQRIYRLPVPDNGKNTYNVGTIQGGTSVNSIPQSCTCLLEYRSDCRESLSIMKENFRQMVQRFQQQRSGIHLEMSLIGERPCSGKVDPAALSSLTRRASASIKAIAGTTPTIGSGSTDCNIPLSLGIPAICFGGLLGDGVHTREEYVQIPAFLTEAAVIDDYLGRTIFHP